MDIESNIALREGEEVLGRYRIDGILREGGVGITYRAYDKTLAREVALKECIPSDFAWRGQDGVRVVSKTQALNKDFEWAKSRFLEEARILSSLRHKNLLSTNNVFEANGTIYMDSVLEVGKNLGEILIGGDRKTESEVRGVLEPILDGLKDMHKLGIFPRDIKPENIIIREDGSPVLIDFGDAWVTASSRSRPLTAMVTPGYAPLEQYYEGGNLGAWTNIYSVGAVGYKMITGENPPEALSRVKDDKIKDLSVEYRGEYSKELLETIDASLRMDENERPRSIVEVLEMLKVGRGDAEVNDSKVGETDAGRGDMLPEFVDNGAIWHYTKIVVKEVIRFINIVLIYLFVILGLKALEVSQFIEIAFTSLYLILVFCLIRGKLNRLKRNVKMFRLSYEAAKQGDADAQCDLGYCYQEGIGVVKNDYEAIKWYKESARQGNANAQYNLGNCYLNGIGVKENYDEANKWFEKSAKQGHANAQYNLGNFYKYIDNDEAIKWYKKSARQGNADAREELENFPE